MVRAGGDMAYGTASFIVRCMTWKQSGTQEVEKKEVKEERQRFDLGYITTCKNVPKVLLSSGDIIRILETNNVRL